MIKPIIAIICPVAVGGGFMEYRLPNAYFAAVTAAGGAPVILPYSPDGEVIKSYIEACDGILFAGGKDIDPRHYGEERSSLCGETEDLRDGFELAVARVALAYDKPTLGICRGAQLLNVALGGSLYQDIEGELATTVSHRQAEPEDSPSHSVTVIKDSPLYNIVGQTNMPANSFHHQAIKKLGAGLRAMAHTEDGIIEAIYSINHRYLYAYQWHPERLALRDTANRLIFSDFISACTHAKE